MPAKDDSQPGEGRRRLDHAHLQALLQLWRTTNKTTVIAVAGGSMRPFLQPGWDLVLEHAAAEHPFGSVIVFTHGRMFVAHRIVGRSSGTYLTKGDALLHFDRQRVKPAQIVGRVVAVQQDGRVLGWGGDGLLSGHAAIALMSRLVGELNRIIRPLRRLTGPTGRLAGKVPGPTRMLKALNRLWLRLFCRAG